MFKVSQACCDQRSTEGLTSSIDLNESGGFLRGRFGVFVGKGLQNSTRSAIC